MQAVNASAAAQPKSFDFMMFSKLVDGRFKLFGFAIGKSPSFHADGNEKLRRWGFYIYGGIDGFSRFVLVSCCCIELKGITT